MVCHHSNLFESVYKCIKKFPSILKHPAYVDVWCSKSYAVYQWGRLMLITSLQCFGQSLDDDCNEHIVSIYTNTFRESEGSISEENVNPNSAGLLNVAWVWA